MKRNIPVVSLSLAFLAACTDLLDWIPTGPGYVDPNPPADFNDLGLADAEQRGDARPVDQGISLDAARDAMVDTGAQDAARSTPDLGRSDAEADRGATPDVSVPTDMAADAALDMAVEIDFGGQRDMQVPDAALEPSLLRLGAVVITRRDPLGVAGYFEGVQGQVDFEALRHDGDRIAVEWRMEGEAPVLVELVGIEIATLTIQGEVLDGLGVKDPDQLDTIDSLAEGPLVPALAVVPQELTCLLDLDDADLIAATTFAWQMLLKYAAEPPLPEAIEPNVVCHDVAAAAELGVEPPRTLVESDTGMPRVFGVFPLDHEGLRLVMPEGGVRGADDFILEGGPCADDRCPGTCGGNCGVSCDETQVSESCALDRLGRYTGSMEVVETTLDCGSHPICRAHDSCYDACSRDWGCRRVWDGWDVFTSIEAWAGIGCRRQCDVVHCVAPYLLTVRDPRRAVGICALFALGVPPVIFDERLDYQHHSIRNAPQECPPGDCDLDQWDECGHCPAEEACNGQDDDCDTRVDEGVCNVRCQACLPPGAPQDRPGCGLNAPAADVVAWCDYNNNLCRNGIRWCADRPPVDAEDRCCNRAGYEACRACCANCGCAQGC